MEQMIILDSKSMLKLVSILNQLFMAGLMALSQLYVSHSRDLLLTHKPKLFLLLGCLLYLQMLFQWLLLII
jgi:hypothetical protein